MKGPTRNFTMLFSWTTLTLRIICHFVIQYLDFKIFLHYAHHGYFNGPIIIKIWTCFDVLIHFLCQKFLESCDNYLGIFNELVFFFWWKRWLRDMLKQKYPRLMWKFVYYFFGLWLNLKKMFIQGSHE